MAKKPDYDNQLSGIDERIANLKAQRAEIVKKKEAASVKEVIEIFKDGNLTIDDLKELISTKNTSKTLQTTNDDNGKNATDSENNEKEKNDK